MKDIRKTKQESSLSFSDLIKAYNSIPRQNGASV